MVLMLRTSSLSVSCAKKGVIRMPPLDSDEGEPSTLLSNNLDISLDDLKNLPRSIPGQSVELHMHLVHFTPVRDQQACRISQS